MTTPAASGSRIPGTTVEPTARRPGPAPSGRVVPDPGIRAAADSWVRGDHQVACIAMPTAGGLTTGSLRTG